MSYRRLIKVYKGTPKIATDKGYRVGGDLQEYFRMKFDTPLVANLMQQFGYGEKADKLNIYFPYPKAEENLIIYENFAAFNKVKQKTLECNGERIITRLEYAKDSKGNSRPIYVGCDEPCQKKPSDDKCPLNCSKPGGKLIFQIAELYHAGYPDILAEIDLRAYSDLKAEGCLPQKLASFESELGRLDRIISDDPIEKLLAVKTGGKIPFVLHRSEVVQPKPSFNRDRLKTGIYDLDATTWAVDLRLDPQWLQDKAKLNALSIARDAGLELSPDVALSIVSSVVPQFAGVLPAATPASSDPKNLATNEERRVARQAHEIAKAAGWTVEALKAFFNKECNIYSFYSIPKDPQIQQRLFERLADRELAEVWNQKVMPSQVIDVEVNP